MYPPYSRVLLVIIVNNNVITLLINNITKYLLLPFLELCFGSLLL